MEKRILWSPGEERGETLREYLSGLKDRDLDFSSCTELHQWSVDDRAAFWSSLFSFFDLLYDGSLTPAMVSDRFLDYGWFPEVRLNFAENLLRRGV